MSYAAKLNRNRCPAHPGALLREDVIPPTGRSKTEIAATLGISRQRLYDILRERKPVSPFAWASCSATVPGCWPPTTPGRPSASG